MSFRAPVRVSLFFFVTEHYSDTLSSHVALALKLVQAADYPPNGHVLGWLYFYSLQTRLKFCVQMSVTVLESHSCSI
jgi:hypothetical protein